MRTMTKLRRGVWGASVPGVRAMHKVSDVIVRGVKLRRGVGAAVVLGMLAGGCAKLPMTGPVVQGGEVSVRDGNLPAFLPREPAPDATPEAIVQGFLQAVQAGPGEGFRAARRFLSDGASRVWDPLANVRLYAQARPPLAPIGPTGDLSLLETAEVEVPFEQVASVDETGHYAVIGPETTSLRFAVTRDARGRWRISTAPEAIVLSDAEFALQFRQASVYFPDLAGRVLVPDVRYFPRAEAARGIVRAFAAGPPAWLADAVLRPLPAGSGEDLDPVSIDGSLVEVRLGGQAFLTAQAERDMVVACLTESLKTLPDVATVEVVVQGVQWNASGRGPQAVQVVNPSQDVFVLIEDESEEADGAAAADNPDDGGEAGSAEDGTEGGGASGGPEGGDGAEGAGEGGGASGGADGGDAGATAGTDAGTEDPEPEEEKGPTLGTLAVIEEGDLRVVPAFKDARFGDWSSLTIASDGRQVAGLGSDGAIWTVDPREAPVPLGGVVSAMAPVYDSHSWLWTVAGRSKSREVLAFPPGGSLSPPEESAVQPTGGEGEADGVADGGDAGDGASDGGAVDGEGEVGGPGAPGVTVEASWLQGSRVLALVPARDGTRMAVVSRNKTGVVEIQVSGIVRTAEGAPTSLTEPLPVRTLSVPPVQLTWADPVTLAILAAPGEGQLPVPHLVTVGGGVQDLRAPGAAGDPGTGIVAGATQSDLSITTESGALYTRSGPRWTRLLFNVRLPSTPA